MTSLPDEKLRPEPSEAGDDAAVTAIAGDLRTFAHDLNNPLAVILGLTQLILLDSDCRGKIRADMEKVYSETQRVVDAVEQLHSYASGLRKK